MECKTTRLAVIPHESKYFGSTELKKNQVKTATKEKATTVLKKEYHMHI